MELVHEQGISALTAEKLKVAFDRFDTDGSGVIDYEEFRAMLGVLLNVSEEQDLARDRVYRFWKEIDRDSSGEVDFLEFCHWYLKYFSPEGEATDASLDGEGILGKFYSTFDPGRQRASLLAQEQELRFAADALEVVVVAKAA
jgi:hypothetical protein